MLCDVLRHRGHTCEAVATRPEAFDMMSSFAPDVVLLEWAMRDESGRGLARRLCAQSVVGNWDIAIILLTIVVKLLTQVAVVEWSRSARTWTKPAPGCAIARKTAAVADLIVGRPSQKASNHEKLVARFHPGHRHDRMPRPYVRSTAAHVAARARRSGQGQPERRYEAAGARR